MHFMKEKAVEFSYQARYFQVGEINASTKQIILAIHGYGQQAKYFIKKFKCLEPHNVCVIAPEGLSRFYLEGFSGRVGATWMTKEDRLTDIKNYISYLNQLYEEIKETIPTSAKISLLGFSQGSATVSRWAINGKVPFTKMVLWAGIFPPDMNFEEAKNIFEDKDIHYVYGLNDPYINKEKLQEMDKLSKQLGLKPIVTKFEGDHVIEEDTLKTIFLNNS